MACVVRSWPGKGSRMSANFEPRRTKVVATLDVTRSLTGALYTNFPVYNYCRPCRGVFQWPPGLPAPLLVGARRDGRPAFHLLPTSTCWRPGGPPSRQSVWHLYIQLSTLAFLACVAVVELVPFFSNLTVVTRRVRQRYRYSVAMAWGVPASSLRERGYRTRSAYRSLYGLVEIMGKKAGTPRSKSVTRS